MHLRTFHRWHALAMSVIVIMSASSGLLHTWMTRFQAPPPSIRPADELALAQVTVPPAALPGPAAGVSLRMIGDHPWWQVIPTDASVVRWIDARSGVEDPTADERYAHDIAARALGDAAQKTGYLTAYDAEYIAIFRILPVYRFAANDGRGTRVYVSTLTGSITRATDDAKQVEANTFSLLHKWMFISNRAVRDWMMMIAMSGIIILAVSGLLLFWLSRQPRIAKRSPTQ